MESQPSSAVTATAEALERRMLLTSSVWFDGETLFVRGDGQAQTLEIIEKKDAWPKLQLSFDADGDGLYTSAQDLQLGYANVSKYDIRLAGGDDSVLLRLEEGTIPITSIRAELGAGNDSFKLDCDYQWFNGGGSQHAAAVSDTFDLTVVGGSGDDSVDSGIGRINGIAQVRYDLGDGNDLARLSLRELVYGEIHASIMLGDGDDSFSTSMVIQSVADGLIAIDAHGGAGRDTLTGSAHRQDEEARNMAATIRLTMLGEAGDDHIAVGIPTSSITVNPYTRWFVRDTTVIQDESTPRQTAFLRGSVQYRNEYDPAQTWSYREWSFPGLTVYIDSNNNGELDDSEPRTVTDQNGSYNLGSYPIGDYTIRPLLPPGWKLLSQSEPFVRDDTQYQSFTLQTTGIRGNVVTTRSQPWNPPESAAGNLVFLDLNRNGKADTDEPRVVTDETGYYEFLGLAPGTYKIACIAADGWAIADTDPVQRGATRLFTVAEGELQEPDRYGDRRYLFYIARPFSLSGHVDEYSGITVYLDRNVNGQLDPGEQRTVTDAAGAYTFGELPDAEYSVEVVAPDGFVVKRTVQDPRGYHSGPVVVKSSVFTPAVEFTLNREGLGGVVRGGVVRGSAGQDYQYLALPGVQVYLDRNSNGVLDAGEPRRITDADGRYHFQNETASSEVELAGIDGLWSILYRSVVQGGTAYAQVSFSLQPSSPYSLSGTVFDDANRTGWQDDRPRVRGRGFTVDREGLFNGETESGIPGVTVYLDANGNGSLDAEETTAVTDAFGRYRFYGTVDPATLRIQVPDGWTLFCQGAGNFALVSEASPPETSGMAGTLYVDSDHDGIFARESEGRAPGVRLFLDANGNHAFDKGERATITDSSGNYSFGSLPAGHYTLCVDRPAGWLVLAPEDHVRELYLGIGQTITDLNFGLQPNPAEHSPGRIIGTLDSDDIQLRVVRLTNSPGVPLEAVQVTINGVAGSPFLPIGPIVVYGRSGDDKITIASDVTVPVIVRGGIGDDTILGGRGADRLYGEAGTDSVSGGFGDDTIVGHDGPDLLIGGDGCDLIYGGPGDDHIEGGGKADRLHGGLGNDTLISGAGSDLVFGEDGDDELCANHHPLFRDQLRGGPGQDKYEADEDDLLRDVEELLG